MPFEGARHLDGLQGTLQMLVSRQPPWQFWNCLLSFALVAIAAAVFVYQARVEKKLQNLKVHQAEDVQAIGTIGPSAVKHILGQVELPELEKVQWLNSLVDQTWPHINRVVSPILQQILEDLISHSAPAWLSAAHLKRFDLGYNPPKVHGIRVYPVAGPDGEKLTVELDVEWHSLADIALSASVAADKYLLKPIGKAVNLLTNMMPLTVGVKSVTLSGRFCIMTGPLLNKMPIVTFAKAGLIEKPFLFIELVLFGASCSYLLAPLQTWINTLIGNNLKKYIVPESENMPVAPDEFKQIHRPCGLLFVTNLSATNVPKMDIFTESDPYIKLFVLDRGQSVTKRIECQKTTVKLDEPNPVWGEEFRLPVYRPNQELTLQMWDWDLTSTDDEIGQASLAIQDLMSGTAEEVAAEIRFVQGRVDNGSGANSSTAEGVSSPIKKRNGKPCIISCKVTYHAFSHCAEPFQPPTKTYLDSATSTNSSSDTVSPLQGLSRTVSQLSGPQGPERQLVQDGVPNSGSTPFGSGEQQRRIFSEGGSKNVRRTRSWGCGMPFGRGSSSIERRRSQGKTSMSSAAPKGNAGPDRMGSKTTSDIMQVMNSLEATSPQPAKRSSISMVSEVATSGRCLPGVSSLPAERLSGRLLSRRSSMGANLPALDSARLSGVADLRHAAFSGGMLYVKVRGVSLLNKMSQGRRYTVDKALPLRMTVKVTVAAIVKLVVVATDRNAREDQILVFDVSNRDEVGMVELEVRGDSHVQGHVKIPFQSVMKTKRMKGDFPVKGANSSQLTLSVSLAWEGSH